MTESLCFKKIGVFGDGTCPRLAEFIHCRNCPEYARAGRLLFDRPQPPAEQELWTGLLSCEKEVEPAGTVSALVFRAAGEWFALKTAQLQEIADLRPVHSVPYRTSDIFRGVANINGELLLCVDPAPVLGLAPEPAAFQRMIVAASGSSRFALMVAEIAGVHRIAPAALHKPPATVTKSSAAFTAGLFALEGRTVGLLDEQLFFDALSGSIGR